MSIEWLPDETLFSLVSRYHRISGAMRADETCLRMFGHRRQGTAHDFPARVDHFVSRTAGAHGDAASIILGRSLLPFFLPLRDPSDARAAVEALRVGTIGGIKARLGVLASRFGAAFPLKACRLCMQVDTARFSVAFWHRDHQWPGVWTCQQHDCLLEFGLAKVNGSERFSWLLPMDVSLSSCVESSLVDEVLPTLRRLSDCACGLGNLPAGSHLKPDVLVQVYQARCQELGLARNNGWVRPHAFANRIALTCNSLGDVYGLEALQGDETSLVSQFTRLVRHHRGTAHPLRHLVLVTALFDSWAHFIGCYLCFAARRLGGVKCVSDREPATQTGRPLDERRRMLEDLVAAGVSTTTAASACGVAVGTAMAWASKLGIRTARRPKKLVKGLRESAVAELKGGASKQSVARNAGVSIETVTRLLRTEPGLSDEWSAARFAEALKAARSTWMRAASRSDRPVATALRTRHPAVYSWLYRNDRAWLRDFGSRLARATRGNNVTRDWAKRDRELARAVGAAAEKAMSNLHCRQRLSALCDAVPTLKRRLSDLAQLPLTRAAVAAALRRTLQGGRS